MLHNHISPKGAIVFIDFLPVLKYDPNMSRLTSGCFVNEKEVNSRNMGDTQNTTVSYHE